MIRRTSRPTPCTNLLFPQYTNSPPHTAAHPHPLLHLDITSAFTSETYKNSKHVQIRQLTRSNGTFTKPGRLIEQLHLNLYGTNSACHIYHEGFDAHLSEHHYTPSDSNLYMYEGKTSAGTTLAAVTINDIFILAPTNALLHAFRDMSSNKYTVKYLRPQTEYVGWKRTLSNMGPMHAAQPKLLAKSLIGAGPSDANTRSPLPKKPNSATSPPEPHLNETETLAYKYNLGDLRNLANCICPDIAIAKPRLARYMTAPTARHIQLLGHRLRYHMGTEQHGIRLPGTTPEERITAYSDTDYAEAPDIRSTTFAEHYVFDTLLPWQSKNQSRVALITS